MARKLKKYSTSKKRYMAVLLALLFLSLMAALELTNTTYLFHKQKTIPVVAPKASDINKTPTPTTPATTNTDSKPSDSNATSSNTQSASGTITISRVGQSTGSTTVSLRTVVSGISTGDCMVVFSKDGQPPVKQTVAVVSNANYYSCGVVDLPVSQFSVSGTWNASVYVINSQSVTISNVAKVNNILVQK